MLNSSTKKTFPNKGSHFLFASAWRCIGVAFVKERSFTGLGTRTLQLTLHNKRKGWMAWFKEVGWVGQNTWRPYSFKRFGSWPSAKGCSCKGGAIWKDKGKTLISCFFFSEKQNSIFCWSESHFFSTKSHSFSQDFQWRVLCLVVFKTKPAQCHVFNTSSLRNAMLLLLRPLACAMPCFMFVLEMLSSTGFQGCFFS